MKSEVSEKNNGKLIVLAIILICIGIAVMYTVFLSLDTTILEVSRTGPTGISVTDENREPRFDLDLPTFAGPEKVEEALPPEAAASIYTLEALDLFMKENNTLYFVKDKALILPEETQKIESLIEFLKHYKEIRLEFRGHTADVWLKRMQLTLSLERAKEVQGLVQEALGSRVAESSTVGLGSEELLKKGDDEESRRINRRVQVRLISAKIGDDFP